MAVGGLGVAVGGTGVAVTTGVTAEVTVGTTVGGGVDGSEGILPVHEEGKAGTCCPGAT